MTAAQLEAQQRQLEALEQQQRQRQLGAHEEQQRQLQRQQQCEPPGAAQRAPDSSSGTAEDLQVRWLELWHHSTVPRRLANCGSIA